ncbi:MAG: hypothetical protein EOO36_08940 [Cytophagaceae bacterium]|nr:MAG: hypothetical protein EOO36_08940 [Cytophagaceae bacterium]
MKHLFYALALLLPGRLLAQVGTPSVRRDALARDTAAAAEWTLSLEANQRTFYLGREYGDKAFSLAPSLSYSHPSGLYGTVSGYYFNQSEPPHYAFTDLELGYANNFTKAWAYSVSYDRVFFTPPITVSDRLIANALEVYTDYRLGPLRAALDYNFFFGKSSAQTLTLGLSGELKRAGWLGFETVRLTPGAEVLWGAPLALSRYGGTYSTTTTATATTTVHGRRKTTTATQTVEAGAQVVRLLGYELSLPLQAERGALAYTLTGHYIIPRRTADDPATPLRTGAYLSLQVDFSF